MHGLFSRREDDVGVKSPRRKLGGVADSAMVEFEQPLGRMSGRCNALRRGIPFVGDMCSAGEGGGSGRAAHRCLLRYRSTWSDAQISEVLLTFW